MLDRGATIAFYVFLTVLLVGGINWGVQSFAGRDILALIINTTGQAGGSMNEAELLGYRDSKGAEIASRIIYALVFASALIVAILLIYSAATGGSVIPSLEAPGRTPAVSRLAAALRRRRRE